MSEQIRIDVELAALENEYNALAKGHKERYVPTWVMRAMVLMQKQKQQRDDLAEALDWTIRFIDTYAKKQSGPATPELNKARAALAKMRGKGE